MSYDGNDSREWLERSQRSTRESPHMQRLNMAAQQRAQEEHKSGASLGILNFLTENLGASGVSPEVGVKHGQPATKATGGRAVYRPRSALEAHRLDTESTTFNLMTRSTSASFKSFNATAASAQNLKKPKSAFGEQPVFGIVTRPRPSSAIFQQDVHFPAGSPAPPSIGMKGASSTLGESAAGSRAAFWKRKLSHLPHSSVQAFGHEKSDKSVDETVSALLRAEVAQLSLSSVGISQIPGHVMVMYELKVLLLSDNKLSSLPPAFKGLALLRLLDLSCNQFACVPRVVQHLDNLNVLLMPDNFLDSVPPFVSNCRRLEVLDVARNHVTTVACQVSACAHLQFLGLDGNDRLIFPPKTVVRDGMERLIPYMRAYKVAVDACDSTGTLDLSGVIEASAHCIVGADIIEADELSEELALSKEIIPCPALTDVFDHIIVLDISRTGCTTAPPWDFFPVIQVAIMDGNRLSSLTIPVHQSLQQLSARGNSIRQVNAEATGTTLGISVLLLDDNLIERPPVCLRSCLTLHRLSLQGNKLVSLCCGGSMHDPADMLPMVCPMLQDFDASMNQIDFDTIKDLDSASVPRCSVISMCLRNNRMTCLPKALLMACPQITHLDISSNSLIELPDAFLHTPQLRILNVDINPLKFLPPTLFISPHLNQISRKETVMELPPQFFGEVLADASLTAARRFSQQLMLTSPKQVKSILALDRFGFQRLMSSWFDAVVNMSSYSNVHVEGVVLSKNHLSLLPEVFLHFKRLQALVLDSNRFEKIPEMIMGLTSLTLLDLSQNQISLVQNSISDLSLLQELCLGSNPILALPRTLHLMTNLSVLRIDIETLRFPPRSVLVNGLQVVKEFYQQAFYANVGCIDLSNCGLDEADPYWLSALSNGLGPVRCINIERNILSTIGEQFVYTSQEGEQQQHAFELDEQNDRSMFSWMSDTTHIFASHNRFIDFPCAFVVGARQSLVHLDMSHNHMKKIPVNVFPYLSFLGELKLEFCGLHAMPADIGCCRVLTTCNVSHNSLSDIPSSIGYCARLESLNISHNTVRKLPDSITALRSLKSMNAEHNALVHLHLWEANNMPCLQHLLLTANKLRCIPLGIGKCPALQRLEYDFMEVWSPPAALHGLADVGGSGSSWLSPEKGQKQAGSTHESMSVSPCSTAPLAFLSAWYECIVRSRSKLIIENLPFGSVPDVLFDDFSRYMKSISHIHMTHCDLTVFSDRFLVIAPQIVSLDLSHNRLTGVPTSLKGMSQLASLNFCNNQIAVLPTWIATCSPKLLLDNLETFKNNPIVFPDTSMCATQPVAHLRVLHQYVTALQSTGKRISLEGTAGASWDMQRSVDHAIVTLVRECPLISIDISKSLLKNLPPWVCQGCRFSSLVSLNLNNNRLQSLPDVLSQFLCLKHLSAVHNAFSEFPAVVALMNALEECDLRGNNFQVVPITIGERPILRILNVDPNVSACIMDGKGTNTNALPVVDEAAPQTYFDSSPVLFQPLVVDRTPDSVDMAFLRVLSHSFQSKRCYFASECVHGVPSGLMCLTTLTTLDLSNNSLPSLPCWMSNLVCLSTLAVAGNEFQELPDFVDSLRSVVFLNLQRNRLRKIRVGHNIACSLQCLLISGNLFSGELPSNVFSDPLPHLALLDVSSNSLERVSDNCSSFLPLLQILNVKKNVIKYISPRVVLCPLLEALHTAGNFISFPPEVLYKPSAHQLERMGSEHAAKGPFEHRYTRDMLSAEIFLSLDEMHMTTDFLREYAPNNADSILLETLRRLLPSDRFVTAHENDVTRIDVTHVEGQSPLMLTVPHHSALVPVVPRLYARSLDLSCFALGCIPEFVFSMDVLVELHLRHCGIFDISPAITVLTNLRNLDVASNSIKELPLALGSMPALKMIDVVDNPINCPPKSVADQGPVQVNAFIKSLHDACESRVLNLQMLKLQVMPDVIMNMAPLRALSVRQNAISAVPRSISLLTNLTKLDIGENSLIMVPRDLFSLLSLRELLLDHNSLTGISEHVAQLQCLELLDVSFNRIKEVPIPELAILRMIGEIRLVGNKITVPPEETQLYGGAACVRFLKSLQFSYSNGVLNLNDCNLTVIPDIVFSSNLQTRLLELHLDDNLLSVLPERLQHLLVLRVLSVRRNRIAALPTVILRLTSLTELRTAGNVLTSIALPHSISDPSDGAASEISVSLNTAAEMTAGCLLNVIRRLALSQASVDGVANLSRMSLVDVPQMVTDAQFVKELDLSHNSVDMLPVDIGNMANLRLLRVRNNLLRSLPESLLQLHMLEHLDCRCNGLAKLPYGMGRMMNLRTLLLGSNRLRFLPFDLGVLTRLSTLQICLNDSISFPPQHLVGPLCFLGSNNAPTQETRKQVLIEAASKITDSAQQRAVARPLSAAEVVEIVQLDFGEYLSDMLAWMRNYGQRFDNKGGQALLHVNEDGMPMSLTQAHDLDLSNLTMRECWPLFPPAPWKTVETLISVNLAHNELWEVPKSILQCAFLKALSLASNRFAELPEFLVEFKWLEKLSLDDNNFSEIPSSVFEMGTLTSLSVSHNNLVVISESISKLDRLKTLSISHNRLREVPAEVGGLFDLETLEYANNLIDKMVNSIVHLQKLRVLDASCNKIQVVPDELARCTALQRLDLTKNPLQCVTPLIFLACTSLQIISLQEIQTLDFPPRQIVSSFSQLLRYEINSAISSCSGILDVSRFDLRVINVYALELLLARDSSSRAAMYDLMQAFQKFNAPNKEAVVEPWGLIMRAASSEYIDKFKLLEICADGNAGLHQVVISSRAAASLQVISVCECSLQSAAWPFVVFSEAEANRKNDKRPEVLQVEPTTEETVDELSYRDVYFLNLSRNKLNRIPAVTKFMLSLRILDFCDNEVDVLPERFGHHCPLLEVLLMDRNQVSIFCESIQNLNRLKRFSCVQNQVRFLPNFLGQLTSLTELNFERNSISNFPVSMGTLTQLTNLGMEWENISYLPGDVKSATASQQIRYVGSLLASQTTSVLDISGFGLHEVPVIPTELLDGPPIKSVNLGTNFLETVPVWLAQLRHLTDLNISNNRLTELNPHVMGHLSHLKTLDVSNNTVIGFLPSSVAFCKDLVSVNIENCTNWVFPPVSIVKLGGNAILRFLSAFTGEADKVDMSELALSELPSDMRTFEQAKILWLDYNHLTKLPASIGKCKNLTSLSVANNFLTELPSELVRHICPLLRFHANVEPHVFDVSFFVRDFAML
jgi:Leucine-rich repeat (LRR) protein